jgi:periplasmic protein TonB
MWLVNLAPPIRLATLDVTSMSHIFRYPSSMNLIVGLHRRVRRRRLGEKIMKGVVVAGGVGLVAGAGLFGIVLAGLAMMQFAPIVEPEGSKRAPITVIHKKPEPPPSPPQAQTTRTPKPAPFVRPTSAAPTAPPVPDEIAASPQPAPFGPAPAAEAPPPAAPVVATARPIGAPPRPVFPARAEERGREGTVVVRLIVGADGDVISATIVSEEPGDLGFGQAALAAVRRTKFEPKRVDGAATLGEFTYSIRFRLD